MVKVWINKNYYNIKMWIHNIIKTEPQQVQDDILHDVIIIFMNHHKSEDLIKRGEAKWFIVRITLNQVRSKTSDYYKTYKPPFNEFIDNIYDEVDTDYDYDKDNTIETLLNCLDELYNSDIQRERYYAMIILLYITENNFSELERRLGIPRNTISQNYYRGIELLKEKYNVIIDDKFILNNKSLLILKSKILKNYGK